MIEEVGLQAFPKNSRWWRRRDVLWHSIPQLGSSDWKSSIGGGWKTSAFDNKRWRLV